MKPPKPTFLARDKDFDLVTINSKHNGPIYILKSNIPAYVQVRLGLACETEPKYMVRA